jgi:hypothetical protein
MEKQKPLRIVRDLWSTPYKSQQGMFEFRFSSDFNRRRFEHYMPTEKRKFSERMSRLYGMRTVYALFVAFSLYARVERRGYLVYRVYGDHREAITDPASIQLVADVVVLPEEAV